MLDTLHIIVVMRWYERRLGRMVTEREWRKAIHCRIEVGQRDFVSLLCSSEDQFFLFVIVCEGWHVFELVMLIQKCNFLAALPVKIAVARVPPEERSCCSKFVHWLVKVGSALTHKQLHGWAQKVSITSMHSTGVTIVVNHFCITNASQSFDYCSLQEVHQLWPVLGRLLGERFPDLVESTGLGLHRHTSTTDEAQSSVIMFYVFVFMDEGNGLSGVDRWCFSVQEMQVLHEIFQREAREGGGSRQ